MGDDSGDVDLLAFLRKNYAGELHAPNQKLGDETEKPEVAEIKSSKRCRDGPIFSPCVVCDDPRGTVHFGAVSCAACSAFFRRTISENRKYSCRRSSDGRFNCPIDHKHRCYCRACRLQKCLLMGMDPGSVQLHRDTYGSKIRRALEQNSIHHQSQNIHPNISSSSLSVFRDNVNGDSSQHISPHSTAHLAEQLLIFSQTPISKKSFDDYSTSHEDASAGGEVARLQHSSISVVTEELPTQIGTHLVSCPSSEMSDMSSKNLIDGMVDSYRQMLERRRLVYCPDSIRDILGGTMPTMRPACYYGERVRHDRVRLDIALLIEFLNSVPPFPMLKVDDKVALVKNFSICFSILEKYYITMRAGGLQTSRIFHNDGTYTDLEDPDSITEEANKVTGKGTDRETLNKLFIQPLKDFLLELSGPMYHNNMTDVEFCALTAILLFDPGATSLSELGSQIVREARDRVYNDWFGFYDRTGVCDIGQRVGNTMLLIPAVKTIVETAQENFRLIQVTAYIMG
ncbi:hypothetical protein RB195_000964 [Necator americanus]|uniref:Zinc finger, C4 type n=1 Tax=Necator americanus TaxID=51031 RepID=A0ABR1DF35_NECAM